MALNINILGFGLILAFTLSVHLIYNNYSIKIMQNARFKFYNIVWIK